jgi:hypothetical protein
MEPNQRHQKWGLLTLQVICIEQPGTIGVITQAFRVILFFISPFFQCPFGFLSDPKNKKLVCPDCRAMSCAKGANTTNNSIQNAMTTLNLDGILNLLQNLSSWLIGLFSVSSPGSLSTRAYHARTLPGKIFFHVQCMFRYLPTPTPIRPHVFHWVRVISAFIGVL